MKRYYRKLQKISESYFVSLPKAWIKTYELDKSYNDSSVAIDIRSDGALLINPKAREDSLDEEITLEATKTVGSEIIRNSFEGIERITVLSEKFIDEKIKKEIYDLVIGLPNTEIIEDTPQRIVIQNLGYKKVPTKQLIQRLLYIVSDMFEGVKTADTTNLKRMFRDLRNFYFILVTHIRTYLRTGIYVSEDNDFTPLEAMDYRMFCQKISKIGETLKELTLSDLVKRFFEEIEEYFKEVMEAFLKKDRASAYELWYRRDVLKKESSVVIKNMKLEAVDVERVKDMLLIAHNCKDMAALI